MTRDQSIESFFGDYAPVVRDLLHFVNGYVKGNVSPHVTYRDLSRTHGEVTTPANLIVPLDRIEEIAKAIQHHDWDRHFNRKYRRKCTARNQRWGPLVAQKFESIPNGLPRSNLTADDVIAVCDHFGIKELPSYDSKRPVKPPRAQAAVGLFIDHTAKQVIVGAKGDHWDSTVASECAYQIAYFDSLASQLTWDNVRDRATARRLARLICQALHIVFVPAWRVDGGPEKLRMLYMGNTPFLRTEMRLWHSMHQWMLDVPNFGYRFWKWRPYLNELIDLKVTLGSFDFEAYDENQPHEHLLAVYEAWQRLSDLPEHLAVVNFLINTYGPTIISFGNGLFVRWKEGGAASGMGGFAFGNTLGCAAVNRKTSMDLYGKYQGGVYMGDDQSQPVFGSAPKWITHMKTNYCLGISKSDSPVLKGRAYFLRRIYAPELGPTGAPILMSRVRNAVFPEYPDPWTMHSTRRALALRAQSYEIYFNSAITGHAGYQKFQTLWDSLTFHPWNQERDVGYLSPYVSDRDLSRRYQVVHKLRPIDYANEDILAKIDYARSYVGVSDFSDVYTSSS